MGLFLGGFASLLLIGVPVALALGVAAAVYLVLTGNVALLEAFPSKMISGIDKFVLLTIPLFLLAGNLMNFGGLTDRIVAFSRAIVGTIRGGLSLVNVLASMFFGGVSGAATADSSALGTILIPAMVKDGYKPAYAAALTAVSSVIGPIIPPSIAMIIFGALSGASIGKLFVAGIVPGLLLCFSLLGYAYWRARRENYPVLAPISFTAKVQATGRAIPALILPVIIIGGILSGVFTPTESAAVAVIYAFVASALIYRELRLGKVWKPITDAALVTSAIMFIAAMASFIAFVFGIERIPQEVATSLLSISENPLVLLLLLNVFLLFLGLFLEPISAMILMMPVLLKLAPLLGIDIIHLGMIVVLNLVIGLATPPVGILFIVCAIGRVPLEGASLAALPMIGICLLVLLLVTFIPELTLFLPSLFNM